MEWKERQELKTVGEIERQGLDLLGGEGMTGDGGMVGKRSRG
jgi:hypothetical protein